MKTALILTALLVAFGIVGTIDHQVATDIAVERTPRTVASIEGDQRHGAQ
ncbi:hypothetical protein GO613_01340 [Azoarcus communis]|nr:hypothetical protein [Parazoarcus communis]NMG46753.1 hypothetical protein [Parazoarcus communis]